MRRWRPIVDGLATRIAGVDLGDEGVIAGLPAVADGNAFDRALRSALATAVADLGAQARGLPLAATLVAGPTADPAGSVEGTLGAPRARVLAPGVAVNALLGIGEPAIVAEEARRLTEAGFGCLKLKGGAEEAGILVRRVAAVRESVGPLVGLRLDLNGSLDEASAIGLLEQLVPFRLDYVEQPIPVAAGVEALARLRRRTSVPIAADEAVTDQAAAEALLRADAVDAMVVKPARTGGPAEASCIVHTALSAGVRVTVACLLESGVGVAAALHLAATVPGDAAHGLSTASWLASDLLTQPLVIRGGRLSVPRGPGLGIAVDPGLVARYRVGGDAWHA